MIWITKLIYIIANSHVGVSVLNTVLKKFTCSFPGQVNFISWGWCVVWLLPCEPQNLFLANIDPILTFATFDLGYSVCFMRNSNKDKNKKCTMVLRQ